MVKGDQTVQQSWSNVETNYQRRTDLYNSVVKTIQGSANFEKSTLTAVIEARSKATSVHVDVNDPNSLAQYQQAQGQLQSAFGRLLAVAEAYPQLQTTQAFRDFQTQIEGTENRINIARRDYNDAVNDLQFSGSHIFQIVCLQACFIFKQRLIIKPMQEAKKHLILTLIQNNFC